MNSTQKPSESVPVLDGSLGWQRWRQWRAHTQPPAYAMYSSCLDGIVTDPALMFVPVDDHLVHRGDGVFETVRCVAGALYALGPHLDRLEASAAAVGLSLPCPRRELETRVVATVRAAGRTECAVRILLARGAGGFGVNPYESLRTELYIAVYAAGRPFMETHPQGARVRTSTIPLKPGFLATNKTCNYLPNVLMKKEAVDQQVDFVVAFDERGCLAEGAIENFAIVDAARTLRIPPAERILAGITMCRVAEIAAANPARYGLGGTRIGPIPREEVFGALELIIFGTTTEVAAAVELDGHPIGSGRPGTVAAALWKALRDDMLGNPALRTPVFD